VAKYEIRPASPSGAAVTTAASTIAPMAMAIQPSDMMLALTPCQLMTEKAIRMPNGKLCLHL
jgi:hypothetical protein